jgi:hypothetical protein
MSDLVQRLRRNQLCTNDYRECADRIEALEAECQRYRAALEKIANDAKGYEQRSGNQVSWLVSVSELLEKK